MRGKTLIAITLSALTLAGAGCAIPGLGGGSGVKIAPVTLQYWRTNDDPAAMQPTIDAYRKIHPNIQIVYARMRPDEYELKLLEALAENRGPDIFSIPSVWLAGWKDRLLPMPKETVIATQTVNAQKQIVTVKQKKTAMSILDLRNSYVEGVTRDVIMPYQPDLAKPALDMIFGLPYSFDTLAIYYNKDLLKKASIEKPPATWKDVQDQSVKMTVLDKDRAAVKQSGAALGGAKNILYNVHILTAIMSQNGADLADENGYPLFNVYTPATSDHPFPPGTEALVFYQSFADPGTPGYAWNEQMPLSLDAFVSGKAAFFFGFPTDMLKIRERAPKLDFGIAPLPQMDPSAPKNIPEYPIEVVSLKTKHGNEAWDFLQFAAGQDQVEGWLTAVKRPTAIRDLIQPQLTDPDIAPFAGQVLTARSWYRGRDWSKVRQAFNDMILARPTAEHPEYQRFTDEAAAAVQATLYSH